MWGVLSVACLLAGCASPGPPLPPTLNLPEVPAASTVNAERDGGTVIVRWTTPERTTDHLLIKGRVTAEICRELADAARTAPKTAHAMTAQASERARTSVVPRPCAPVVATAEAKPGSASQAIDSLPAELASGMPRLLRYRVQLKNASGRTAGASTAVFAAAGAAPAALEGFHAHAAKTGVVLEWSREASETGDKVELERTTIEPASGSRQPERANSAPGQVGPAKQPAALRLMAGAEDAGGTVDRSVALGGTYRYTAWRVRTVTVAGRQLEIRGPASVAAPIKIEDVFPPDAPQGLVAVPAVTGGGAAARAAIDLSWEPNDEPRIAGYRIYRREGANGAWQRISGAAVVTTAAYRDTSVAAGTRYAYCITAVGLNGLESAQSSQAEETASTP